MSVGMCRPNWIQALRTHNSGTRFIIITQNINRTDQQGRWHTWKVYPEIKLVINALSVSLPAHIRPICIANVKWLQVRTFYKHIARALLKRGYWLTIAVSAAHRFQLTQLGHKRRDSMKRHGEEAICRMHMMARNGDHWYDWSYLVTGRYSASQSAQGPVPPQVQWVTTPMAGL